MIWVDLLDFEEWFKYRLIPLILLNPGSDKEQKVEVCDATKMP